MELTNYSITFYIYCLFSEDFRNTLLRTMKWPWFNDKTSIKRTDVSIFYKGSFTNDVKYLRREGGLRLCDTSIRNKIFVRKFGDREGRGISIFAWRQLWTPPKGSIINYVTQKNDFFLSFFIYERPLIHSFFKKKKIQNLETKQYTTKNRLDSKSGLDLPPILNPYSYLQHQNFYYGNKMSNFQFQS